MPNLVYKINCFYIEDREGNYVDSYLYCNDGMDINGLLSYQENKLDISKLDATISLNHELNHYIQDLSVNACIVRGHLHDLLTSLIIELSKCKEVKFPLFDTENYNYNHSITLNTDYTDILQRIDELYEIHNFIFGKHSKPDTEDYSFNSPNEDLFRQNEISVDFFLETYAYHKAYWDAFRHFESNNGMSDILHELVKKNRVYPIRHQNNNYVVDNYMYDIRLRKQYQLINLLLMFSVDNYVVNYLDYCERDIPKNYCKSQASFTHITHQLIFEAALYIPSLDYIWTEVYCNKKDIKQFSPVHRFYLIIKAIRDNEGYPDSVPGDNYFKTFYNWVAEKYEWLQYDETYESIKTYLSKRISNSNEVLINYQHTLTSYKHDNFIYFYQSQPENIMRQFALPLIVMSENGLIFYQYYGELTYCPTGLISVYDSFFGTINRYECYSNIESSLLSTILNNQKSAFREIICRLFSTQVRKKHMDSGVYSCPFGDNICPRASQNCCRFTEFKEIFSNCKKIVFRGDNGNYLCNNELYCNTYDCMFYNYLLDINYGGAL